MSLQLTTLKYASEDLCADMGMTRTPEGKELLYTRGLLVTHAKAFNLQAIDMVCVDFKNLERLLKESIEGKQMGYTGKQAIHPAQIDPIYQGFQPSEKEVKFATKIIEMDAHYQQQGIGAFTVDGQMVINTRTFFIYNLQIDMPMVKWAKNIIQLIPK